jgi:hypothetical protein
MAAKTIEIQCLEDGSYSCSVEQEPAETAGQPEPAEPADATEPAADVFTDPQKVLAWVQQQLAGAAPQQNPKAAWAAEAQGRDASGYRQPNMTM